MHRGLSKEITLENWKKVELSASQMFRIAYKQLCVYVSPILRNSFIVGAAVSRRMVLYL